MLTAEQTKEADAVEKYFCQPFEKLSKHPMSDELSKMMITLLFSKKEISIPEKEKPFLLKVIETRIKHSFTFTILDIRLSFFLCVLSQTPGTAIMYLTYLQYWAKNHQLKVITFDDFCKDIFPMGFPSDEDLHQLWISIKVKRENGGSDNLLDYQSAMESIQFSEVKI